MEIILIDESSKRTGSSKKINEFIKEH